MRWNEKEIIEKLQGLRSIQPSERFSRTSRRLILESKNASLARPNVFTQLTRSLSFAFETALVATLFLVVILGGVFGLSKSVFLPPLEGIDEEALVTEANAINKDIDLKLNEIAYFGNHKTSTERVVALREEGVLGESTEPRLTETVTDEEIDKLLNQVINGY